MNKQEKSAMIASLTIVGIVLSPCLVPLGIILSPLLFFVFACWGVAKIVVIPTPRELKMAKKYYEGTKFENYSNDYKARRFAHVQSLSALYHLSAEAAEREFDKGRRC